MHCVRAGLPQEGWSSAASGEQGIQKGPRGMLVIEVNLRHLTRSKVLIIDTVLYTTCPTSPCSVKCLDRHTPCYPCFKGPAHANENIHLRSRLFGLQFKDRFLLPGFRAEGAFSFSETSKVQPRTEEDHGKVEHDECPEDTIVEPLVRIRYIEAGSLYAETSTWIRTGQEVRGLTNSSPVAYWQNSHKPPAPVWT